MSIKSGLVLPLLITLTLFSATAQKVNRQLAWNDPVTYYFSENHVVRCLNFTSAFYPDESGLPHYIERIRCEVPGVQPGLSILSQQWLPLTPQEEELVKGRSVSIGTEASVNSRLVYENKAAWLLVDILPLRFNNTTGRLEKLQSFYLKTDYASAANVVQKKKARVWKDHSVLATGDWYRVDAFASGVHIITYQNLADMGMNLQGVDPRTLKVFGNGARMISENNAVFRFDDLQENAIIVSGESDGVFDPQDYIIFYAQGPVEWKADTANDRFYHVLNKYCRTSAYFVTAGGSNGKRIPTVSSLSLPADYTATTSSERIWHEVDSLNLIKSGREFYGEVFDVNTTYTFIHDLPGIVPGSQVSLRTSVLARSVGYNTAFRVYAGSTKVLDLSISPVSPDYTAAYARLREGTVSFGAVTPLTLRYDYSKNGNSAATGWLDYYQINYDRYLSFGGGQLPFRNIQSAGKPVTEFILSNVSPAVTVWDVTDFINPVQVLGTLSGSTLSFKWPTDTLREFVSFDGSAYMNVSPSGRVANQDLHGLGQYKMVIVSYPGYIGEAARVADFHRNNDNMSVVIVTPEMIYNEYSSGNQDVTAIKDFLKMMYDRAGADVSRQPGFLLLFGDASYDYLNRVPDNTNLVPTYQTENSLEPTSSFLTDDYFGFLDDWESGAFANSLDLAIGRFAVKTADEAHAVVNKLLYYTSRSDLAAGGTQCNNYSGTISNLAEWRNVICFVADDTDKPGENFLGESESIARRIDTLHENYNLDKIYLDAFPQVSTPGGQRYPDANLAINKRVEKGALIINYIGHGGEVGWSHEAVLGVSDINGWDNQYNLPFFVTATCEFSRFDDPGRTAAGEYVHINPNGGGVGLFTTTRLAFSGSNFALNNSFFNYVLKKESGAYPFIGDVVKRAKNDYGCASVISNFSLLCDPAMRLAYPEYNVVTSEINMHPVGGISDTLKALAKITVSGYIADGGGIRQSSYQGTIWPIVFDKAREITSYGNDAGYPQKFNVQKNIIYKGKASVSNGDFRFTFVVPKDIAYDYGRGRISYYSQNGTTDASGYYNEFIIGGSLTGTITDGYGPDIRMFLNNEKFVSGGITDKNPLLLVYLSDTAGLNTVGNAIGHDISAVLDKNTDKTIVLNEYFESDLNTYQSGIVRYPLKDVEAGNHTLDLKAWDVYNNSSESAIDFVVAESADLALSHVLNYPNPFTTYTEFWFEHNQPCCGLDVQIQIFTITGKLVKTINTRVETNGYRADPIPWDGKDDYGDPIGRGVYMYMVKVKNEKGGYAEKLEKLVILR